MSERIARVRMADGRIARFKVPEGTTQAEVESYALRIGQEQPTQATHGLPSFAGTSPTGAPLPLRDVPPIPEVISPEVRQTPRSEGILETIKHATAGEAMRFAAGAQELGRLATGRFDTAREARERRAQIGAEQAERFEERPISTLVGQMAPYMAIPGRMVSTLPRATGTGGLLGFVGGGGDPMETAIGAGAGGAGYAAGRMLAAPLSKLEPFQQRALAAGRAMGITPTPAQETGGGFMQMLENSLESYAFSRGATARAQESFQKVANRVAAESIGETGDVVDDLTLGKAAERIGNVFKKAGRTVKAPIDGAFLNDMIAVQDRVVGQIVGTDSAKVVDDAITEILDRAGKSNVLTGKQINNFSSELKKKARSLLSGEKRDPDRAFAFQSMADALDDLLERNVTPDKAAGLRQAKEQWRNLVFLEQPGVVRGGQVSARTLSNVLRRRAKGEYQRGGRMGTKTPTDRLFSVARYGEAFPQLPSSGTAQRLSVPIAGSSVGSASALTGDLFQGTALAFGLPFAAGQLWRRYPWATGLGNLPARYGPIIGRETARTVLSAIEAQRGRQ